MLSDARKVKNVLLLAVLLTLHQFEKRGFPDVYLDQDELAKVLRTLFDWMGSTLWKSGQTWVPKRFFANKYLVGRLK